MWRTNAQRRFGKLFSNTAPVTYFSTPIAATCSNGFVYYSTIPLDFYLDGSGPNPPQQNFARIYAPNMLAYGDSLKPAPASDWYSVTLAAGAIVYTATPGDGGGEPGNTLNPHIELYNSSGGLVATGAVLLDGRNESLTAPAAGSYRIRV